MKLITLYVHRNWVNSYVQTTILKDKDNKVKAIIPNILRQPKYGQKTIVLNCWLWALDWSNVQPRKNKLKTEKNEN